MTSRVLLVCHAASAATRHTAFPGDEPIAVTGGVAEPLPRFRLALCGPELRCRQTGALFGIDPETDEALRDCDYGRWRGRLLAELAEAEPAAVRRWLTDPAAAPHGGESIVDVIGRVGGWLDALPVQAGRVVAVTHPAVIKAAIVHAIRATPESFWRIDVAPLSRTTLSGTGDRWTLTSLAN